jgi:hypothetical protein
MLGHEMQTIVGKKCSGDWGAKVDTYICSVQEKTKILLRSNNKWVLLWGKLNCWSGNYKEEYDGNLSKLVYTCDSCSGATGIQGLLVFFVTL